jgi:transcription elongation GreA/GreB family factor
MKRKAELESQIVRARGSDFANPRVDVVSIGTAVRATDMEANHPEVFTILGAWDSDPEKGVISYMSPVAQALLNKQVGDQVEFEVHGVRHHHRIDAIEAIFKSEPPAAAAVPPPEAASATNPATEPAQ